MSGRTGIPTYNVSSETIKGLDSDLITERQALFNKVLPQWENRISNLATMTLNKVDRGYISHEDIIQEIRQALWEACVSYNPGRDILLSTWLHQMTSQAAGLIAKLSYHNMPHVPVPKDAPLQLKLLCSVNVTSLATLDESNKQERERRVRQMTTGHRVNIKIRKLLENVVLELDSKVTGAATTTNELIQALNNNIAHANLKSLFKVYGLISAKVKIKSVIRHSASLWIVLIDNRIYYVKLNNDQLHICAPKKPMGNTLQLESLNNEVSKSAEDAATEWIDMLEDPNSVDAVEFASWSEPIIAAVKSIMRVGLESQVFEAFIEGNGVCETHEMVGRRPGCVSSIRKRIRLTLALLMGVYPREISLSTDAPDILERMQRRLVKNGFGNLIPKNAPSIMAAVKAEVDIELAKRAAITAQKELTTAEIKLANSNDDKEYDTLITKVAQKKYDLIAAEETVSKAIAEEKLIKAKMNVTILALA